MDFGRAIAIENGFLPRKREHVVLRLELDHRALATKLKHLGVGVDDDLFGLERDI